VDVAVINPGDKARFGEDSTALVYRNAEAVARRLGVELVVGGDVLRIGDFEARWAGGRLVVGDFSAEVDVEQWEAFVSLVLNYFVGVGRPPDGAALRDILFAVGVFTG
jgi:hypothetical protein